MNPNPKLLTFTTAARECAMQMMLNAAYIQRALPTIEVPEEIQAEIDSLCQTLIGTKHDIMTDVFEVNESTTTAAAGSDSPQVDRIINWLAEARGDIDGVVRSLQAKAHENPKLFLVSLLVTESATNILNACNAAENAADSLRRA
jgi:hypothetical protein